jgi:hypothetical protein
MLPDLLAFRACAIFPTIVLREGIIGRMVSIDTINVNLFLYLTPLAKDSFLDSDYICLLTTSAYVRHELCVCIEA